jgi:hypothetical protein
MRLAGSTVMFALLLGAAPALTQESPSILPTAAQSEAKAARAQAAKHAVRRKAAPHITTPETVSAKTITPEPGPVKSEPALGESAEISPGDRLKIQSALLWSGDYTGSIGGEDPFSPPSRITRSARSPRSPESSRRPNARTCSPPQNLMKTNLAGRS